MRQDALLHTQAFTPVPRMRSRDCSCRDRLTVVSEQGKEAVIAILSTDDFFGEGCLAGQAKRIATVTTMTDAVIARLEKSAITRVIHEEPAFSELFIAHLLGRSIRVEADLVHQLPTRPRYTFCDRARSSRRHCRR